MEKSNSNQIKRDCFIALLLPVAMLSLIHLGARQDWSAIWIIFTAMMGFGGLGFYLYQFFIRLENLLWQEQLISLIKKISTPVLLADTNHEIVFMNDSFNRVSFLSTILKYKRLPELLALQKASSELTEQCREISNHTDVLDNLTYKIKTRFKIEEKHYQWILIPIFSPLGERWGTLVECVVDNDPEEVVNNARSTLPFANMLDQLPMPVMLVGKNEIVRYVNLSLKMLLVRHQGYIRLICPTWNLYDPTGDTLDHFLKLIAMQDQSFQSFVESGGGSAQFKDETYQLVVQDIVSQDQHNLGTLVIWQ